MGSTSWSGGGPLGGPASALYRVDDPSHVGEVRRAAETLAADAGLSETERGTLAIVVTEIATNLARHAHGGRILLREVGEPSAAGVELIALDEGPGIPHVGRAMEDGFSSAGTSGHGLGAIRRMATDFDLYSRRGEHGGSGTALLARVWSAAAARARTTAPSRFVHGAVCVALGGGRVCGDAWTVLETDRTLVVVADGLGHGPDAAEASSEAIRVVRGSPDASPGDLLDMAHGALRSTRGAAIAIAEMNERDRTVRFAGIGNISAALHGTDGSSRSLASHNGTVGHAMRKVQEFLYDWPAGGMLLMHSDGIHSRWRLDAHPGLHLHDPTLVAGVVYREAARGRDDATVVALRERRG